MKYNLNNKEELINVAKDHPDVIYSIFNHFMRELNSLSISIKDNDNLFVYNGEDNIKFEN